ncbi:MAG: TolC family protein [Deferribacteraceae bacterium]|jgi:outer membrane protein TolC|nr:TolC family protein [Deferribacteraceae bacterium]
MKLFPALLVILLLTVAGASALTLEEAVNQAIQNNDSIRQQSLLLESRKYARNSRLASFSPNVGLSYGYNSAEIYDSAKPTPNPAAGSSSLAGNSKESSFSLNMGFNLFNGFADLKGYNLASVNVDMQRYAYEGNRQDIILATKSVYISYLNARSQLNVANETLTLLEAQKKIAEVSFNVGQFSKADVLRVDVQLASTQLDLLNAQIALKRTRQQLERYIGRLIVPEEEIVEIEVADVYPVPPIERLERMLEENRSEMRYIKSAYEAAGYVKDMSLSGFLPKLNLGLTFGWNGDDSGAFGGRENNYDGSRVLSLSLTWNIFQGLYDYNTYRSNSYNVYAAAYAVSDLRKTLRLQLSDVYEYYFSAREMVEVAKIGVEQARENYRVTESQYENSQATTTDLLNASVALNRALNSLASANYTIITSVAQLERAVETELLGFNIDKSDKK